MRFLHELAASELAADVERERPPLFVGKFRERLFHSLMHKARGLVFDQLQAQET